MPFYFAYGSNMHRARLVDRVGTVDDHGRNVLAGYRHEFAKRGDDGTAKGTLFRDNDSEVHGVLYTLSDEQFAVLTKVEGGYNVISVTLQGRAAHTFVAEHPVSGLSPTTEYLAHYLAGMKEHHFPEEIVRVLVEQAAGRSERRPPSNSTR